MKLVPVCQRQFLFLSTDHATLLQLIMFWREANGTSFYVLPEAMALERGHKFQRKQSINAISLRLLSYEQLR
jgi:hypothetical protein